MHSFPRLSRSRHGLTSSCLGATQVGDEMPAKPAYFRYLTIMAMHVFLQEKVRPGSTPVGASRC